jgi:ubiquinone biosynthesis monooxygenase Coq7
MATPMNALANPAFSRRRTFLDSLLIEANNAMQVLAGAGQASRPYPAGPAPVGEQAQNLSEQEKRHAAGLMRVNHVGEVCAQALYRGQALFCRDAAIQEVLLHAAAEEVDHLVWCDERLNELNSRPSIFNPLWYAGSFTLGVLAGRAGTGKNLGFMAETERQVEEHLNGHLNDLPISDGRSRCVVEQMRNDEIEHRSTAERNGADTLSAPVKLAMRFMSKIMTTTAYRL